ncbi:signal peptidase I [Arthrobacter sp. B6]|uniref:signal peptidase I n=1 Tax=Arthrobacter sp. B6 TaxID=1570137 RepID=UPI00082AC8D6|nr:signal peptidase I [Arthrobacter sp. B6]
MASRLTHRLTSVLLMAVAVLVAVAGIVLVSGQAAIVITHGVSMNPVYHQGDLVMVTRAPSYSVGEIAAYNLPDEDEVALHRITDGNAENGFIFKGDNNQSVDPLRPRGDELVGRAVLHIPQGGLWLKTLTSPPVLGVLAFALLTGGSAAAATRRRRKKRRLAVSRHTTTPAAPSLTFGGLPSSLRVSVGIGSALAILGVVLGVPAWSGPLDERGASQIKNDQRMDFSYTADVGQSAAYDGTTANSPDPVFRKVADTVDVHFTYFGERGTVNVTADLSTPAGWRSSVPLTGPDAFTESDYNGTVTLDLKALEAKAQAASAVTGTPAGPLSITVTPQITTAGGALFRPGLKLNLTPLQLTLNDGTTGLSVAGSSTTDQPVTTQRMLGLNGMTISAAVARFISAVLLLAALAVLVVVLVFARRAAPADEAAAIRRRYAALLVRVHPMPAPHGRPVIDVTTFPTLAKLAERYGLLVLHWSRSGVETFVVQDENITYRYRAGSEHVPAEPEPVMQAQP